MAHFNRMRYDYRGPEYDRRYGRYEGAFARRFARDRRDLERAHRLGRRPDDRPPRSDQEFAYEDREYSRRHLPPAVRRSRRMF